MPENDHPRVTPVCAEVIAAKAHVVLDTGTTELAGNGTAHRHPADTNVPEICDEPAAGRAMDDLAQQLLNTADRDIQSMTGNRPNVRQTSGRPV
ncbi:dsRBD fold-containing protein [Streptomyces sp. NPDC059467]|uniref:dsRBD fold-containing protein n=1 Tax=Streptomyces sp. NPDC059467 TaxID=3346844 RepID=UPI003692FDF9